MDESREVSKDAGADGSYQLRESIATSTIAQHTSPAQFYDY